MNPHAQEFIPLAEREASSRSAWREYPSQGYLQEIQRDSGLTETRWQPWDAGNGAREAGEVQGEGMSRVGSRKLSFSQAEMNFDDVFDSPRASISPRGSRKSMDGQGGYGRRSSHLSVRVSGRQPSIQLSIAEDDDEWAEELEREVSTTAPQGGDEGSKKECSHEDSNTEKDGTSNETDQIAEQALQKKIGPADFHLLAVVGQGSFGKVFQVRKKDTGRIYAMKVMRKERILEKDHAGYVWSERDVLTSLDHPYIVRMLYSFQTAKKLYLVLEFINGGHLFYQLFQQGCFLEDQTRFYAAEIVSAISFLHEQGVVHRDLKPENVLLDEEGHIKVTDFGLCKGNIDDDSTRADSFVGTIQYMAPEIIKGEVHGKALDWWSVGILIYEMLAGQPPFDYKSKKKDFNSRDRKSLMNKITSGRIPKPRICSRVAWDLIQGLLSRNPSARLGSGGSNDVKMHPFFKSINWEALEQRKVPSQFKPILPNSLSVDNFEKRFTKMPAVDSPCGTPENPNYFAAFQGYTYTTPSLIDLTAQKFKDF